jgi:predicted MFS family arabinose efflux permease
MVLALILAVLVFTNAVRYEYILILAFLQGITNAIDLPARQTFVFEIVGRKNLMNALALNSVIQNLARIMGPAIAAALMATVGAGWCFFVNALSFMALIVGLIRMKVIPYVRGEISNNVFCEIKDGLRYMYNNRILFQTLLMVLVIGTFSCNYNVLMPVFVKDILHQGAEGFGILMAAMGIGSLIGALTISGKNRSNPSMTVMLFSALIIGVLYALIGFIAPYAAILVFFAMIGTFGIYFATTANAMLQVNSTDQYRGRIISVYCMVFAGAIPVGSLLSGLVIDNLGITPAFKLTGILIICLIIIIFLVFLRPWVLKKASNGNKYRCKK